MTLPRNRQILVVEDDKSLRKLLADILEGEGYEVSEAGNGKEAMSVLRATERPPDLIVLDLMLPKMNGWDFRAALSEDDGLSDIPLLVVSGIGPDIVSIAADGHLHKPLDLNSFLSTVQRLVDARQQSAAQRPMLH
jgi:two-component system, chemotaxis family, chemotaxis protein CheY